MKQMDNMKFSRKLILCNWEKLRYRKYQIELPAHIMQQYESLPNVRIFSWKYDFLKNALVEKLGKFPQFTLWNGNGPESQHIAQGFRDCSINWDKAVAYLALEPLEEDCDVAGVLFLTNGVAFCVRCAPAEFYPWLEVSAMPLLAIDTEDSVRIDVDTPHRTLWCFDVTSEDRQMFAALAEVFDELRSFCMQGASQLFFEYINDYIALRNRILLQLKTDTLPEIEDAVRQHIYCMRLAAACNLLTLLLPSAQDFISRVLIPQKLFVQAQQMIALYANYGVQFPDELVGKINYTVSQYQDELADHLKNEVVQLFVERKFAQAEKELACALQKLDHPDIVKIYYAILKLRNRYSVLQTWLNSVSQMPENSVQRMFLEKERPFLEAQQKIASKDTLLFITANEDIQGLSKYATYQDSMGMTALMYAVFYDIPSVVDYYRKYVPNKETMYAAINVLGMRAIELAAINQTGFEFCKLCAEIAKPDLQKTKSWYQELLDDCADRNDMRLLLHYRIPYPQECSNPFRCVMESPPRKLMENFVSTCHQIQRDAKELFYAQVLLYALGPYEINHEYVDSLLPTPVSANLFKKLLDEQTISKKAFCSELIKQDTSLQKDEFETMEEYKARIQEVLQDKIVSRYGPLNNQVQAIFQEAKKQSLQNVDRNKNFQAFAARRLLLMKLFGWNDSSKSEGIRLGKYNADEEIFNLESTLFSRMYLLEVPRSVARQIAQQYRDGNALPVFWDNIVLEVGDDPIKSNTELMQWVIDHEDEIGPWNRYHSFLLQRLANTSGGLIPPEWIRQCTEVCDERTLRECIFNAPDFDDEENAYEWQEKRNLLLLRPELTNVHNTANEYFFRHVVTVVMAARAMIEKEEQFSVYVMGHMDFNGESYIIAADLPINNTVYFPAPDKEWFDDQ